MTTTTRWPVGPGLGHLGGQLLDGAGSTRPAAVVTEDDPILTTTVPTVAVPAATVLTTGLRRRGWLAGELGLVAGTR